jgi:hypothetical protein
VTKPCDRAENAFLDKIVVIGNILKDFDLAVFLNIAGFAELTHLILRLKDADPSER